MESKDFNQELITKLTEGKSIKSATKRVPLESLYKLKKTVDDEIERKEEIKKNDDKIAAEKAEKIKKAKEELEKLGLSPADLM